MIHVGEHHLRALAQKGESALNRLAKYKEKAEETAETVFGVAEVGLGAFASGFQRGRWGGVEVIGVPVDLGAAVIGHLGAFMLSDRYAIHVRQVSNGLLGGYFATLGAGIGAKMLQRSGATTGALPFGYPRQMSAQDVIDSVSQPAYAQQSA